MELQPRVLPNCQWLIIFALVEQCRGLPYHDATSFDAERAPVPSPGLQGQPLYISTGAFAGYIFMCGTRVSSATPRPYGIWRRTPAGVWTTPILSGLAGCSSLSYSSYDESLTVSVRQPSARSVRFASVWIRCQSSAWLRRLMTPSPLLRASINDFARRP